jgi:hypothetical protein
VLRCLAVIGVLTGCDQVFGLNEITVDGGEPTFCDPLPFDASRYYATRSAVRTWQGSRNTCLTLGMDIAVIDEGDALEIANELSASPPPTWWGVSWGGTAWLAVDTCKPLLPWATGYPQDPTATGAGCVLGAPPDGGGGPGGMQNFVCANENWGPNGQEINVLCETPRPSARCRAQQDERDYVVLAGLMTHDQAGSMCRAMARHLVEIDSSAELQYLVTTTAQALPAFWIGATHMSTTWMSPAGLYVGR